VDVSWINRQITARAIPYLKVGKYTERVRNARVGGRIEEIEAATGSMGFDKIIISE